MKSEPGSSAVDHETGKVRGAILEEPCRQYHLQQLGDNRRLWVQSHLIIPFTGIADYEQLAIQDVKNISKIYKPKTEAAKVSWREAVLVAQQLEPMPPEFEQKERRAVQALFPGPINAQGTLKYMAHCINTRLYHKAH